MYLHNPETNDLKISNSPLEGYKEISQVRYKALLYKKADQKIKSYGKKLISIDGKMTAQSLEVAETIIARNINIIGGKLTFQKSN
jgi:hypothetical protein